MNHRTILLVPLLAVGCASARPTTAASRTGAAANQAAPGTRVICEYEKPTGSNIPVRTCYRVLDDLERNHARDMAIDELNKPRMQMKAGN